jgi:signal transduction histidine kinase
VTGRPNLLPGHYARISVTDQGCGMSQEILARAGDAFFTTKPRGQGTGLGLAGVRGFVERAGGALRIESQQGVGTSITFWLPSITARADGIDLLRTTGCPDNVTMLRFTA